MNDHRVTLRGRFAWIALAGAIAGGMACSGAAGCKTTATSHDHDGAAPMTSRSFNLEDAIAELWPKVRGVELRPATAEQKRALFALIERLWRGVAADSPPHELAPIAQLAGEAGMTLELWTIEGHRTWVVREPATRRGGAGIYLVRAEPLTPGPQVVLEAPHVYFDLHTQIIAANAFFAGDAAPALRGLFTNSLHRYQQTADERERRAVNPADVGHNPNHLYQAATAAALTGGPVAIVQLHGFDGELRDDDRTAGTAVIVSAGQRGGSTPQSTAAAQAIAAALRVVVARFPEDTDVLGGTTNVQGRLVDSATGASFVHIEMAAGLRRALASDRNRCAALGKAVVEALVVGAH